MYALNRSLMALGHGQPLKAAAWLVSLALDYAGRAEGELRERLTGRVHTPHLWMLCEDWDRFAGLR